VFLRLLRLFPLLILLLASCSRDEELTEPVTKVNVGDEVPAFVLSSSNGKELHSSSLAGQAYLLNFFDTGCPDCRQVLQVLQQVYTKYGAGVPVLNVPRSQSQEEVSRYWQEAGLTMPFYIPQDKQLYYKFASSIIPRTYVVDTKGRVKATFSDSPVADFASIETLLLQMIEKPLDGDVNLVLRLRVPKFGNPNDEYYFHNEYTVSSLEVWFFDAKTKEFVTKSFVKDLTTNEATYDTQYDITYLFTNVRQRVGVYDIFTLANYYNEPIKAADETEFLSQVDSVTYEEGIEANISERGPVMTNRATSLLGIDLMPWSNKSFALTVDLERVMAKFQIGVAQNMFQLKHRERKYADINITNYKFVNLNRRYYLFQHRDSLPSLTDQPEFSLPYNFQDYEDEGEQYVTDPLFYRKRPNRQDITTIGRYYKSWFGSFTTDDFASMPSANNFGYAYVLENTSFKSSQTNGYSPGVVFKAAVSPTLVYLYDFDLKTLEEEYRPEYWPNTIYLYNYNFYGSIHAINVASGLMLDELMQYNDDQLKPYGIKQCKFNMGVYETFYTYWIQHRVDSDDPMGAMRYGIVRNNFYKMVITGVNGIGSSVITPDIMRNNYPNSYADVSVDLNVIQP